MNDLDFSTLKHPTGGKVVAVYKSGGRFLCKLENGKYEVCSLFYTKVKWAKDDDPREEEYFSIICGWRPIMEGAPYWTSETNNPSPTTKINTGCVCSISDLMVYGCPSSKGQKCRNIV